MLAAVAAQRATLALEATVAAVGRTAKSTSPDWSSVRHTAATTGLVGRRKQTVEIHGLLTRAQCSLKVERRPELAERQQAE
jgi:hypothetical protein